MKIKKIIALYLRISRRDKELDEDIESNSIGNQRGIVTEYVKRHMSSMTLSHTTDVDLAMSVSMEVREFVDDGYSGTSMNRPGLQELLQLAKKGMIYAIIVKDLSRFARNYVDAGNYMERVFPGMGIRFICVNDNYDSDMIQYKLPGIDMAFKGIMHDYYCKELSGKLKTAKKQQVEKGRCIFAKPPYGYYKSDENRGKLVVDSETAPIVKHIFESYVQGVSAYRIAKDLNHKGIDSPNRRLEKAGLITFQKEYSEQLCWGCGVVLSILRNQIYIGDMVGNKVERVRICEKKYIKKNKEEWIIVESTHEAIIEKELYFKVQRMLGDKKRPRKFSEKSYQVFQKKLICSMCFAVMTKSGKHKGVSYYACARCRTADRKVITIHSDFLEEEIRRELPGHRSFISKKINENNIDFGAITPVKHGNGKKKEEKKVGRDLLQVYEKYASEFITKEEYQERKRMLQVTQDVKKVLDEDEAGFMTEIDEQSKTKDLLHENQQITRELVHQYIDKIIVYDNSKIQIIWWDENQSSRVQ